MKKIILVFIFAATVFLFFNGLKLKDLLKGKDIGKEEKKDYEVKAPTKSVGVRGLEKEKTEKKENDNIFRLFKKNKTEENYEVKTAAKTTGVRGLNEVGGAENNNAQIDKVPYFEILKNELELFKKQGNLK